ncbi:hypothetical protein H696_05136 [Fonticula alba]|uniref:Uncharacterized protein n=1 Tax=Fonticula alba TaxID=691883 RepID=A0A058Z1P7_FONAL|nr:hypothetical protein H696_05136 [Fonticula alba]KCV68209.1 hypothetical protein H696_05136 [Fonticula alba]|eukprot:XP_009497263.1 hypothetical protein H696_05136 [Fonticula alba]
MLLRNFTSGFVAAGLIFFAHAASSQRQQDNELSARLRLLRLRVDAAQGAIAQIKAADTLPLELQ